MRVQWFLWDYCLKSRMFHSKMFFWRMVINSFPSQLEGFEWCQQVVNLWFNGMALGQALHNLNALCSINIYNVVSQTSMGGSGSFPAFLSSAGACSLHIMTAIKVMISLRSSLRPRSPLSIADALICTLLCIVTRTGIYLFPVLLSTSSLSLFISCCSSFSLPLNFLPWSNVRALICHLYGFPVKAQYLHCHCPGDMK